MVDKKMMDEIVNYIRRMRTSSTEVGDCLGKTGVVKDCFPVNRGNFACGPVKWVYAYDEIGRAHV